MEHYYITTTKYSVRERQTKNGVVYDAIFRVVDASSGKEKQKSLCSYTTKSLLKRAHAEFITNYCELVKRTLDPKKESVLFSDAFNAYFSYLTTSVKESSCVSIRDKFKVLILPYFKDMELDTITRQDYRDWIIWTLELISPSTKRPYSATTIQRVRGYLKTFLYWVQETYEIPSQFVGVKCPKKAQAQKKTAYLHFWEKDEFERFIAVVDDEPYKTLFYTLFYCGCRKGEALAFSDADYNGKELHICKTYTNKTLDGSTYKITETKAGRDFSVPLAAPLIAQLNKYLDYKRTNNISTQYLFGGDRPLAAETVRRRFAQYIAASGVNEIRIHDLRHSFASMLIHHGASYAAVAELIGDEPEQVIKTYGHLYQSDKIKLIALL